MSSCGDLILIFFIFFNFSLIGESSLHAKIPHAPTGEPIPPRFLSVTSDEIIASEIVFSFSESKKVLLGQF
jgi:hypothetical protein